MTNLPARNQEDRGVEDAEEKRTARAHKKSASDRAATISDALPRVKNRRALRLAPL